MTDAHVAVSASGLLADFNRAGALTWADIHPAQQLGHLFGEKDPRVQLAIALTVRALRSGSICLDLARLRDLDLGEDAVEIPDGWWPDEAGWLAALRASPAVTVGDGPAGDRPLRLADDALYLERHFADQESVRRALLARLGSAPSTGEPVGQDAAVELALTSPVTVIAGGPGVGKTYTIRRIIDRLRDEQPDALVALAAPTGKAAARMTESLGDGSLTALTLHALLRKRPGSMTRFHHDATNPLPHDVVVVDEMSMVSMVMMSRLLEALKPCARLVMVGDPDQLSSVDAGSVLADITRAPAASGIVARLVQNYRFTGAIQELATAIREGDAEAALSVLHRPDASVRLVPVDAGAAVLRERVAVAGGRVFEAAAAGRVPDALAGLEAHRLLCGHRRGPLGVSHWTRQVQSWLVEDVPGYSVDGEFHVGRPVMVTANRPEFGLYNGDTGVVLHDRDRPQVWFPTPGAPRALSPFLLDGLASVHAMTVHKAQGSQFGHVSVVLPPPSSPLLTRELLYTAVSRARSSVLLLGDAEAVAEAVANPARRMSRLAQRLR
ncbi:MAG TPA: exodeoxyribonuclease V subunit alpha [Propionibacterium sp.]|nr:exodeoxyribonuclease V subunit alpha [Propionibacterium sp.]